MGTGREGSRAGPQGWVWGLDPVPKGWQSEGEQEQQTQPGTFLPSLQLRQTPRALQNDEGIKPLFYLILWLRI